MAYTKQQWNEAKFLWELDKPLSFIVEKTGISKAQISKKSTKEHWKKETEGNALNTEIRELDKQKETIKQKETELVNRVSKLEDYQITILDNLIQDETGIKSLLFSTANLAMIRANQMLTKNTKTIMSKVDYFEDGKKIKSDYEEKEIPLSMTDYKDSMELTDKASITLGINPRHANTNIKVDNNNLQQTNLTIEDISLAIANGLPD